jgi:hypothetical protein
MRRIASLCVAVALAAPNTVQAQGRVMQMSVQLAGRADSIFRAFLAAAQSHQYSVVTVDSIARTALVASPQAVRVRLIVEPRGDSTHVLLHGTEGTNDMLALQAIIPLMAAGTRAGEGWSSGSPSSPKGGNAGRKP